MMSIWFSKQLTTRALEGRPAVSLLRRRTKNHFVTSENAEQIYRAIENAIRNAIRLTGAGSTVSITPEVKGQQQFHSVEGQGVGLPKAELEMISRPVLRRSRTTRSSLGLGIALIRRRPSAPDGRATANNMASGSLRVRNTVPETRAS